MGARVCCCCRERNVIISLRNKPLSSIASAIFITVYSRLASCLLVCCCVCGVSPSAGRGEQIILMLRKTIITSTRVPSLGKKDAPPIAHIVTIGHREQRDPLCCPVPDYPAFQHSQLASIIHLRLASQSTDFVPELADASSRSMSGFGFCFTCQL